MKKIFLFLLLILSITSLTGCRKKKEPDKTDTPIVEVTPTIEETLTESVPSNPDNQTRLMLSELLGFNEAIEAAMEWAEGRDDTLMVVTADHETGGLYYDRANSNQGNIANNIKWLSSNHSRTRVDIAVYGNIDEYINKFGNNFGMLEGLPYWDNTDVFKLCSWYLTN